MRALLSRSSLVRPALTWLMIAIVPLTLIAASTQARAESSTGASASLDKHARRIHKRLSRYSTGTIVNVELRDGSARDGVLSAMREESFTLTDSDSNAQETHAYSDVARVSRAKEYIGDGMEPSHHFFQHPWVPVVVGVVAAGAAMTAVEVR
jgi:hypothetical protein